MARHYQEIVDEIFGSFYKHRTLRTLFNPGSFEWDQTTLDEKIIILKRILDSNKISLNNLLAGYKFFYSVELKNNSHVLNSLEDGLIILLESAL